MSADSYIAGLVGHAIWPPDSTPDTMWETYRSSNLLDYLNWLQCLFLWYLKMVTKSRLAITSCSFSCLIIRSCFLNVLTDGLFLVAKKCVIWKFHTMEWSDDTTMCFRWTTDCTNSFDDYVVFMMNLRGHFDHKIVRLLLYCRGSHKSGQRRALWKAKLSNY